MEIFRPDPDRGALMEHRTSRPGQRRSSLDHFEHLRIDALESCVISSVRRPFGHRHCEPECGAVSVFSMKGDLVDDREMFVGCHVALPEVESCNLP